MYRALYVVDESSHLDVGRFLANIEPFVPMFVGYHGEYEFKAMDNKLIFQSLFGHNSEYKEPEDGRWENFRKFHKMLTFIMCFLVEDAETLPQNTDKKISRSYGERLIDMDIE